MKSTYNCYKRSSGLLLLGFVLMFLSCGANQPTKPVKREIDKKQMSQQYLQKAIGFAMKGRMDEAIDAYNRAISYDPYNLHAYMARGHLYNIRKKYNQAAYDYSHVIRIDPSIIKNSDHVMVAEAFSKRGSANLSKDEHAQAINDFTMAIEIHPQFVDFILRGISYSIKRQYDKAISDFSKAIEMNPPNPTIP